MNTTKNNAPYQQQAAVKASVQPPKPPKVGRPDGLAPSLKEAPEDVRWAVWAWVATAGLQGLLAVAQFLANMLDSRALYVQVKKQLEGGGRGVSMAKLTHMTGASEEETINQVVMMTSLIMSLWMVLIAVLCAWMATRAGRGGNYSRMFLSVASLYLVLQAILVVFSSAPATMNIWVALLAGTLSILSGVTAALGLYFMTRPGNSEWLGIPSDKEVEKYRKEFLRYQDQVEAEKKAKKESKQERKQKEPKP